MCARVASNPLVRLAVSIEPAGHCLFAWTTCCDARVLWRGAWTRSRRVALTIDDVSWDTPEAQLKLLLAELAGERATFFVIWPEHGPYGQKEARATTRRVEMIIQQGHEVGVHFAGRWGCCTPDVAGIASEMQSAMQSALLPRAEHARMAGGLSCPSQVTALTRLELTVVNGTAYPFDADLCECLDAKTLGQAAASMSERGGRVAVLHVGAGAPEKVAAFVTQARELDLEMVKLSTLLSGRSAAEHLPPLNELAPTYQIMRRWQC